MKKNKGTVFLVGAGPGDPELITLKGLRLLRSLKSGDALVYDRLANPRILSEVAAGVEQIYVGKASSRHTLTQDQINLLLVRLARQGRNVVRLKGGDPFVFGRGGEEILTLVKHGIAFEVVPGVTSAIAVPSYAGIPVTHRGTTVSFGVFTGQEDPTKGESHIAWDKISTGLGTLVFLMGVENLANICRMLITHGRPASTPAAVVQWGTMPFQRTVAATLADIEKKVKAAGIRPPAILVVGEVVSLRSRLNWFEKKPLFGKKVLVTLPAEDNSRLCAMLEEQGAECVQMPMIAIEPLNDYRRLDRVIERMSDYHWVIFTSQNGVRFFKERLRCLGKDVRILAGVKVAAIGPKTKEAVEAMGVRVDVQPREFTQEGVLKALHSRPLKGKCILLLRAQEARDVLPDGLAKAGAHVDVVPLYRACLNPLAPQDKDILKTLDVVTFTSSSCVHGFFKAFGRKAVAANKKHFQVASIGPVTSAALRSYGLKPAIEAKQFTLDGLAAAIGKHNRR